MPQLLFAFVINPETKEAVFSGNVKPMLALQLLQGIVITDAAQKAAEAAKKTKKSKKGGEK